MTRAPARDLRMRLLFLALTVGLGAVYAGSVLLTTRDQPAQIDPKRVKPVAEAACSRLSAGLNALQRPFQATDDRDRAAAVDAQAALVERFLSDLAAVGENALREDEPSLTWIGDCRALMQARMSFVAGGFTGTFELPAQDGQPIIRRMDAIGVSACAVPQLLRSSP